LQKAQTNRENINPNKYFLVAETLWENPYLSWARVRDSDLREKKISGESQAAGAREAVTIRRERKALRQFRAGNLRGWTSLETPTPPGKKRRREFTKKGEVDPLDREKSPQNRI